MQTTQVKSGLGRSRELISDEPVKLNVQQPWEASAQLRHYLRELQGHSQDLAAVEGPIAEFGRVASPKHQKLEHWKIGSTWVIH